LQNYKYNNISKGITHTSYISNNLQNINTCIKYRTNHINLLTKYSNYLVTKQKNNYLVNLLGIYSEYIHLLSIYFWLDSTKIPTLHKKCNIILKKLRNPTLFLEKKYIMRKKAIILLYIIGGGMKTTLWMCRSLCVCVGQVP